MRVDENHKKLCSLSKKKLRDFLLGDFDNKVL